MKDSILPIPTVPPELITEILSRLPVKSLLRLKCVSKSFVALISSPEFIKTQLCISTNNKDYANHRLLLRYKCLLKDCSLRSVLYESVMEVSHLNYPMTNQRKTFWTVVGSVNGLICLSNEANVLCLWNSSIRKYKKFSGFITHLRVRVVYGFGYDEFHDDYKVVRCVYYDGSWPSVDVKIYSLKDDSWRSICYAPPDGVRLWGSGKFVNGKLHWANNTGPVRDKGWNIISIDLADDKWEKVEQPCCGEEEGVLVLGVLGNNLSVISKDNHLRTHIDVWVMKEYGVKESWTKMFTVKCPHSPASSVFKALFLVSNKDEILLMFGQNFLLYNLKDGSINYPKFNKFVSGVVKAIYVESLVSPVLQHEPRTQYE